MPQILERTKRIIQEDRLTDIRAEADESSTFCLFASLHEIASTVRGGKYLPPRSTVMWSDHLKRFPDLADGKVPVNSVLEVVVKFTDEIGLRVKQILVNPSFLHDIVIPWQLQDKIITLAGVHRVSTPHLRIMCQDDGTGFWYTHAETDNGDDKSQARFKELSEIGWNLSPMVIEFEL